MQTLHGEWLGFTDWRTLLLEAEHLSYLPDGYLISHLEIALISIQI